MFNGIPNLSREAYDNFITGRKECFNDFKKQITIIGIWHNESFNEDQFNQTMQALWKTRATSMDNNTTSNSSLIHRPILELQGKLENTISNLSTLKTKIQQEKIIISEYKTALFNVQWPARFIQNLEQRIEDFAFLDKKCTDIITKATKQLTSLQELPGVITQPSIAMVEAIDLLNAIHGGDLNDYTPFAEALAQAVALKERGDNEGMLQVLVATRGQQAQETFSSTKMNLG